MAKNTRFVGLDVHAETIAVAVAEGRGQVRSMGTVENRAQAVERVLRKVGKPQELKVCYEAGPTGYALYWQLTALGFECEVIAPSLAPSKPGDRVKTDRRDAERLARSYQAGDLTAVWVPDSRYEALRDLVRLHAAAKEDEKRAKHRLRNRSAAIPARSSARDRHHRCRGARQFREVRAGQSSHELHGTGAVRALERRQKAAGRHHQDRQLAFASSAG